MSTWLGVAMIVATVAALPLGWWLGSLVATKPRRSRPRSLDIPPPSKPVPPSKPRRSLDIEAVRRQSRELEIELGVGPYAPQPPVEVTEVEVAAGCGHPVTVHAVDGVPPAVPALCPACWLPTVADEPPRSVFRDAERKLWEQRRRLASVPEPLRGARCEVCRRLLPVHSVRRWRCDDCGPGAVVSTRYSEQWRRWRP